MGNEYRNDEVEIDLLEMFFYVLKKWRVIVIWGVIGLILGCGFSYYRMVQKDPANLETYFARLEKKDASAINEDNITIYKDYKSLYDGLIEYGKKSVVLNMNPNEVYSASANYFYSCEDIKSAESFLNSYLDTEAYETLVKASGLGCTTNDIKEMIGFWFTKTTENNLIVDSVYRDEEQTGRLGISAFAPSQEALDNLMMQLKVFVETANRELKQNGVKFDTYLLNENESFGYSSSVVNKQQAFINERVTYLKNATTYMEKFSDDEKLYIAYYYPSEDTELETGFSKKFPVIIAVITAFLIVAWYAVAFVFDGHIKSENDLEKGTYVIACLGGIQKKGLDKVFDNWSNKRKPQNNDEKYVMKWFSDMGRETIALCYDSTNREICSFAETIKAKNENVTLVGNVAQDATKVAFLRDATLCVSIVKINSTRKSDYYRMTEVCKQNGKIINQVIVMR